MFRLRTIPAIAAAAKPLAAPLGIILPRGDIEAAIPHRPEHRGFLYDIEINTELAHLADQAASKSLDEIDLAVADSFPHPTRHEPHLSLFYPGLHRYVSSFATWTGVRSPTYHWSHVSRPPETKGHPAQLLIGKWHNRAGVYVTKHGDNLVTSAATMILSEDELARIFGFLDPEKDISDNTNLLYLSQFDREKGITGETRFRYCKLDTCSAPSSGIQPDDALIHTAESFHYSTQGMVFLRNLSQALDPTQDDPNLFLLGVLFYGTGPARLSQPFEIAFRHALAEGKKLHDLEGGERLLVYQESENNLGTALEASKRDELMWLHENLWDNQTRQRYEMPLARVESKVDG